MAEAAPIGARAQLEQHYARMNAGMDHALARLLPTDRAPPSNLALPASPRAAVQSWRALTEVFEARRATLQRKENKRRLKEEGKRQKFEERKERKEKKTKTEAQLSHRAAEERGKSGRAPKKSSKVRADALEEPKRAKAVKAEAKATPHGNSFLSADAAPTLLTRLRELTGDERLAMGTAKYNALVRWLEADRAKNAPLPKDLLKLVARLRGREKLSSKKSSAVSKGVRAETLDDRLRAERRKKILEVSQPRDWASAARKRRVIDESDEEEEEEEEEEKGRDSDEEPEYADGYSDSPEVEEEGEAEFEPSGSLRETKTPSGPSASAKEQLQRVVAKIKEEDLMAKVPDAKYLSYEKKKKASSSKPARKYPGSSPKNAIVLDSEEEEEEEKQSDSDSMDVDVDVEEKGGDDEDAAAGESSTDEEQDMFDLNEEDVYIVESILMVKEGRALFSSSGSRRGKEADLYLVKWDGYDELTWEPDANIPKRLVEIFRDRERSKRECHYQIDKFVERRVVDNVTTGKKEVIYLIQWLNQAQAVWEVRTTLPEKTLIWLDKVAGARGVQSKKRIKVFSGGAR